MGSDTSTPLMSVDNEAAVKSGSAQSGVHVLLIDGAYMQIGMRDLNTAFETKFRLEKSSKLLRFLHVMQAIVRHSIDRVIFISAEDYDGMTKSEPFYSRL